MLGYCVVGGGGVVDHGRFDIVVGCVVGVKHVTCDVGDVIAGIGLSRNVDLSPVQGEGVDEVLEETHELGGHVVFGGGCGCASAETSANGLFDPEDVSEVYPRPRVFDGFVGSVLPKEWPIFLEDSFE